MKSKYSHVLMLLAAICAFLPVLAVDFLLDSYVRVRERAQLQTTADAIATRMQTTAYDTISALRRILADSPSLCTPAFIASVHRLLEDSLYLRQVLVENRDGLQYCDALGKTVTYSPVSRPLTIAGRTETVEIVQYAGLAIPAFRVIQRFGDNRAVSAFAPVLSAKPESLLDGLKPTSLVEVTLTDGTAILDVGDVRAFENRGGTEYLVATAVAGDIPVSVRTAVPFAVVRAEYGDLDASFTIVAALMCAAFLLLALQYVRRSNLPAFDLERAIAAGELKPYYQPVINLRTGALAGCEVLVRWEKKNGDVVPPGAFVDYAEVTGLAIPMTISLMQQVRADLGELCARMPDIKISINLFEGHFRNANVVDDVQAIFEGSAISYRQLVFEITERHPLERQVEADAVIAGLHALGARVAMDDTGTGHSNLAFLQTLGIDIIKIDRVFVTPITAETQQLPILDGLITMARELGTEIVAEGVETEAQARYLRGRGVVMAQGYLFAPALKASAFRELADALGGGATLEATDLAEAAAAMASRAAA